MWTKGLMKFELFTNQKYWCLSYPNPCGDRSFSFNNQTAGRRAYGASFSLSQTKRIVFQKGFVCKLRARVCHWLFIFTPSILLFVCLFSLDVKRHVVAYWKDSSLTITFSPGNEEVPLLVKKKKKNTETFIWTQFKSRKS